MSHPILLIENATKTLQPAESNVICSTASEEPTLKETPILSDENYAETEKETKQSLINPCAVTDGIYKNFETNRVNCRKKSFNDFYSYFQISPSVSLLIYVLVKVKKS